MSPQTEENILKALQDIRDGQREIIAILNLKRALAEEQLQKSRATVEESIGLQREALKRQQSITRIAVPGILACIAAIVYLVWRYF